MDVDTVSAPSAIAWERHALEQARAIAFAWSCVRPSEQDSLKEHAPPAVPVQLKAIGDPPHIPVSVVPIRPLAPALAGFSLNMGADTPVMHVRSLLNDWFRGVDLSDAGLSYEGRPLNEDLSLIANGITAPGAAARRRGAGINIGLMLDLSLDDYEAVQCVACEDKFLAKRSVKFDGSITCIYCKHQWNRAAHAGQDNATDAIVNILTRACPGCGQRIAHYHGHECHHISPSGGCPSCKQHFCYVCGLKHGEPGQHYGDENFVFNPVCRHRASFCDSSLILDHLIMKPYPYDSRCGCAICPDCKFKKPCPHCFGNCVVCKGIVPPASELSPSSDDL